MLVADASFDLLNPRGTEGIFKKREMRLRHPARNLVSKHVFLTFNAWMDVLCNVFLAQL